jgi:uncharacterized membrane protein YbaN (DUF454 family)
MEIPTTEKNEKETTEKKSGILKQVLFVFLGFIFITLGIIGIPIPILPTTPFMLLAGYFFLRSSEKLNNWLRNHKFFKRFFEKEGMTVWGKILLDGAVWAILLITAILANKIWVWILTMSLGVTKTLYFIFVLKTIPNKKKTQQPKSVSIDEPSVLKSE